MNYLSISGDISKKKISKQKVTTTGGGLKFLSLTRTVNDNNVRLTRGTEPFVSFTRDTGPIVRLTRGAVDTDPIVR